MRSSRSSAWAAADEPLAFSVWLGPLLLLPFVGEAGRAGACPLLPLLAPVGRPAWDPAPAFPLPFLLGGRIPLRQFSGRAQADNMGALTGWRFWSRSTQIAGKS